jgi:hypothetical protein
MGGHRNKHGIVSDRRFPVSCQQTDTLGAHFRPCKLPAVFVTLLALKRTLHSKHNHELRPFCSAETNSFCECDLVTLNLDFAGWEFGERNVVGGLGVVSSGWGQLVADGCGHGDEQSGVHKVRAVLWPLEELF